MVKTTKVLKLMASEIMLPGKKSVSPCTHWVTWRGYLTLPGTQEVSLSS